MTPQKKYPLKRISKLLADHARFTERGRAFYSKAGNALDKALALKAPLGAPIAMPDGRQVVLRDQFAETNRAFTSASVKRYIVEPYRPDKTTLPTRPRQASAQTTLPGKTQPDPRVGYRLCTEDFPRDDQAVLVCTADGATGTAAYCSEAGNWYIVRPGHPTHRMLWEDVHGEQSEIVSWAPKNGR